MTAGAPSGFCISLLVSLTNQQLSAANILGGRRLSICIDADPTPSPTTMLARCTGRRPGYTSNLPSNETTTIRAPCSINYRGYFLGDGRDLILSKVQSFHQGLGRFNRLRRA